MESLQAASSPGWAESRRAAQTLGAASAAGSDGAFGAFELARTQESFSIGHRDQRERKR